MAIDVLVVFAVYFGGLLLRFDGTVPDIYMSRFTAYIPFIGATYLVVGLPIHSYRSDATLLQVGAAAFGSGLLIIVAGFLVDRPVPTSVLILGTLGTAVGFLGVRALVRLPD